MKKHSYRQLAARRRANYVLLALTSPEIAKDLKGSSCNRTENKNIDCALYAARELIKAKRKGEFINYSIYTPYANEIKKALSQYEKMNIFENTVREWFPVFVGTEKS